MVFYIYSCQDLIIKSKNYIPVDKNKIYKLEINQDDEIYVYPKSSAGVVFVDLNILLQQNHSQINFHHLNDQSVLCEIKPFVENSESKEYFFDQSCLKLIETKDHVYIYFKGKYFGNIVGKVDKFEKMFDKCGLIKFDGEDKHLIIFNKDKIIYTDQYVDYEINNSFIEIYSHTPNIFNIGTLTKYEFSLDKVKYRSVMDRGKEKEIVRNEFIPIYFLDSIKCGRFSYAHSNLSYELRQNITSEVLEQYFLSFDNHIYLKEQDVYITLKNNKVIGIYHFVVNNGLIDKIY